MSYQLSQRERERERGGGGGRRGIKREIERGREKRATVVKNNGSTESEYL